MTIRVDRERLAADVEAGPLIGLLEASMAEIDPGTLIRRSVAWDGTYLGIGGHEIPAFGRKVWVLAIGKAALAMASALDDVMSKALAGGFVLTRHGYGGVHPTLPVVEAGHPEPDAAGYEASQRIANLASERVENDIVLCLISGGGSALLAAPAKGLTWGDLRDTTRLLLHAGVPIDAMNAVRRHLSALQGGGLAAVLDPAQTVTLILSDVVDGGPEAIASGPTVGDPSRFDDARAVLEHAGLWERVPDSVRQRIQEGCAGRIPETVKPGDPVLADGIVEIIGSNKTIVEAACQQGEAFGYRIERLPHPIIGEAREAGRAIAQRAIEVQQTTREPVLIVGGGETTVTVTGDGRGGRNQEVALAAGLEIAGRDGIRIAFLATDGTDGPTDAAGAIVAGKTIRRAIDAGFDPQAALSSNNAYPLLSAAGALLFTGPTGTNVADVVLAEVKPD